MIEILEYITQNYTSILVVLVLILLAIIGYYADKTNFGQGNKEKESKDKNETIKEINNMIVSPKEQGVLENSEQKTINENIVIEKNDEKSILQKNVVELEEQEKKLNVGELEQKPVNDNNDNIVEATNVQEQPSEISINNSTTNKSTEDNYKIQEKQQTQEFEYIESLLPKKELINSDLLNEIEGMEFNSLKEKKLFNVPNMDNISLPKIKNLVEKEQDIWKF